MIFDGKLWPNILRITPGIAFYLSWISRKVIKAANPLNLIFLYFPYILHEFPIQNGSSCPKMKPLSTDLKNRGILVSHDVEPKYKCAKPLLKKTSFPTTLLNPHEICRTG